MVMLDIELKAAQSLTELSATRPPISDGSEAVAQSPTPGSIETVREPLLLVSLSDWGDRVLESFEQRRREDGSKGADPCRSVRCSETTSRMVVAELAEVLNVRHRRLYESDRRDRRQPWVVLLAAAAELSEIGRLTEIANTARQEFQRSRIAGTVAIVMDTGPINGELPRHEILESLDEFTACDVRLTLSDTNAQRDRLDESQRVSQASLLGLLLARHASLRHRLRRAADAASTWLSFGVGRVEVSEDAWRHRLRERVRTRLYERLFEQACGCVPQPTQCASVVDWSRQVFCASGGSLADVQTTLVPLAAAASDELLRTRLTEMTQHTRRRLEELLPASKSSWWQRVLSQVQRLSSRRETATNGTRAAVVSGSVTVLDKLTHAERLGIELERLRLSLLPTVLPSETSQTPWEIHSVDAPEMSHLLQRLEPELQPVAWKLAQSSTLDSLLEECADAPRLCARIHAAADQALRLDVPHRLAQPADHRPLLTRWWRSLCCGDPRCATESGRWLVGPKEFCESIPEFSGERHYQPGTGVCACVWGEVVNFVEDDR